jgi:hypothetical protein
MSSLVCFNALASMPCSPNLKSVTLLAYLQVGAGGTITRGRAPHLGRRSMPWRHCWLGSAALGPGLRSSRSMDASKTRSHEALHSVWKNKLMQGRGSTYQ